MPSIEKTSLSIEPLCPCNSGQSYSRCCEPYHQGLIPCKVEALMRSRYSAYAKGLIDYLINTWKTPPSKEELQQFCATAVLQQLHIVDVVQREDRGEVVFVVHLVQSGARVVFTERSQFERQDERWIYVGGQVFSGARLDLRVNVSR